MKTALPAALLSCASLLAQGQRPPYAPTAEERAALQARTDELGKRVAALRAAGRDEALVADVEVYHTAAQWIGCGYFGTTDN
jgi:hypothetical protein